MNIPLAVFGHLADVILKDGAKKATKYLSEKLVVKATRQGKTDKRRGSTTIIFTAGAPNYAERRFIKLAKKAGEPFPIKKIQVKWDVKRKK
jgi:hypothetical protein